MLKRMGSFAGDAGFTLVEMLVTVTIIGVLAAVVTVGVSGASSNAQTQANKQLFNSVQTGLDAYAANTPSATGVPVTGAVTGAALAATDYFAADGVATAGVIGTDQLIDFASGPTFKTFFRLANTNSTTFKCLVTGTTTFTLKVCHN